MERPSKILEQIAFDTRPKIEEHVLIVLDRFTHEEHLSQPLQTNNKQFKIAVTFLTVKVFLMLQTKKMNSISQDQVMMMILMLLPFPRVHLNLRA